MGFLDYKKRPRIMVVANGHTYDRTALMAMFESFSHMECFLIEHPMAEHLLNPQAARDVDAIVLFDMPGGDPWTGPGYEVAPSDAFKAGFTALLQEGKPIVALHHAIAAWTLWPEYAEYLGGRFLHFPGSLRGKPVMDSGTRADVSYRLSAEDDMHPLFAGLPAQFEINDEAYLFEIFEDSITPLARTDYQLTDRNLYSVALAMTGERRSNRDWQRPEGRNIIAWSKRALNSPLIFIQPGHSAVTYANANYRRLVYNALGWVLAQQANL